MKSLSVRKERQPELWLAWARKIYKARGNTRAAWGVLLEWARLGGRDEEVIR